MNSTNVSHILRLFRSTTFILILVLSTNLNNKVLAATELTILNFNTMCDICNGSKLSQFKNRLLTVQKIIKKYDPDLLSLQEVRTIEHLKKIISFNDDYQFITNDTGVISYADPTIIFKKSKFELLEVKHYWLGPTPKEINFGWHFALPRQAYFVKLKEKTSNKEFYFISSHFDNRRKNLKHSALFINQKINKLNSSFIFAADTNITTKSKNYSKLSHNLINSFDNIDKVTISSSQYTDRDLCYYRKGKTFPDCRVDHVFHSQNDWIAKEFIIDLTKNKHTNRYPSDHRPVIVKLKSL